jgi:hypothetical protein
MTNSGSETGRSMTDPTGARDPGAQLTAHLGKLRVQRQPRLPVDVEAPVLAPLEQDDHPRAVGRVVEHLQLQALVDGVVDDLEVEHAVDRPHLQVERAQQRPVRPHRSGPGARHRNHLLVLLGAILLDTSSRRQGRASR